VFTFINHTFQDLSWFGFSHVSCIRFFFHIWFFIPPFWKLHTQQFRPIFFLVCIFMRTVWMVTHGHAVWHICWVYWDGITKTTVIYSLEWIFFFSHVCFSKLSIVCCLGPLHDSYRWTWNRLDTSLTYR